ncbi:MAG: hypothetical protein JWO36_7442 [Myxococcales bacterium]|nr:hypothetical protein [Myxococcales bacterium]
MSYRIALQGLELASYEIGVGDLSEVGGKQTVVVQAHAKTVGFGAFVKVDDYFSSWIDVLTGRSVRWMTDEFDTNGKDKERTDADLAGRSGNLVPITFHLNDETPKPEPQLVTKPDVWDYNAFLVALRSWEGPAGSAVSVEVLRSRYLWHVEMKIGGKEKLVTELGELPALRFDGHTYKLDRKGGRDKESDERDFTVWISDDDGRVPLKVVAKTDYGDMKMEIVDYQPGTGKRLRN